MAKAFVFCERRDHVRWAQVEAPEASLIALTPESAWCAQELGVPYLRLDDFYADAAINAFAEVTLRREYAWAQWMDTTLGQLVPEFRSAQFAPAQAHLYLLKQHFDSVIRPAKLLLEFAAVAKPDRLVVFERQPLRPSVSAVPSEPVRPLFAWLAPSVLEGLVNVEVRPDEAGEPPQVLVSPCDGMRRVLRRIHQQPIGPLDALLLRSRNLFARRARVAWIGSSGYDLGFAIPILQRQGVAVIRPDAERGLARASQDEAARCRAMLVRHWMALRAAPECWRPFDEVSAALRGVVAPSLEQWLLHDLPFTWAKFLEAAAWLRRKRCAAVLGVEVLSIFARAFFMAARTLGLPRIMAMHNGGLAMDLDALDCLGPIHCDAYLVAALAEVDHYERFKERVGTFSRGQVVPVGSARLEALRGVQHTRGTERLRARFKAGKPTPLVLYVPTQFRSYHRDFNEGCTSDVAYFELQERILKCCGGFPHVRVLYKPFTQECAVNPIGQFLERFVPNGQVVWTPLEQLIWAVDAIIVDFPSTALSEAVLTDKPLLVYAGRDWARLLPEARAALVKRAWVSETPEEFEDHVRRFLAAGEFSPLQDPNEEFLHLVGVRGQPHPAAKRMAERITHTVLNGHEP